MRPGGEPHLHVHIYSRFEGSKTWAQPVELPKEPDDFGFAPPSEAERAHLGAALAETLGVSATSL